MSDIFETHKATKGTQNLESEQKRRSLMEMYSAPEQANVINLLAARTIVGATGVHSLAIKQMVKEYKLPKDAYFEHFGSQNLSLSLKYEPCNELVKYMKEVKVDLTRLRNEFLEKVATYYINAVSEKIEFSEYPTDLTETQKNVLELTEESGFVKTVTTSLLIINRARKLFGKTMDENEQKKRLVQSLKQSRMFDLGYTNAVRQLDHNIKVVTENFDPSYLLDNMWQIEVAQSYFGIKEFKMYDLQVAILGENGIFINQ